MGGDTAEGPDGGWGVRGIKHGGASRQCRAETPASLGWGEGAGCRLQGPATLSP